jgi:putative membrane protein
MKRQRSLEDVLPTKPNQINFTMQLSQYSFRVLSFGLCLGLATSCAKREDSETAVTTDSNISTTGVDQHMGADTSSHATGTNTTTGMDVRSFNDANILALMGAADSMEIAMGNMAKTKAEHADIKKFAAMMVTEHTKMKKEGQTLAQKLNIAPAMPAGDMVSPDMTSAHSTMQSASGHAFDSLYIGSQVAMHQHVLDNLNNVNPQNAELKAAIDKAKPHVQHHLDEAKRVQEKFHAKH